MVKDPCRIPRTGSTVSLHGHRYVMLRAMVEQTLTGRIVAVPETRELDVFAGLLERRGASVLRCPLVAIRDAPDARPVLEWIRWFTFGEQEGALGCDDLILLTGEGLRRLLACIDRNQPQWRMAFIERLGQVRKITRGPKPARVLRELGLKPDVTAQTPTTPGVITALKQDDLGGRTVGVQLYGTAPNRLLIDFLEQAGAQVRAVAPYVYASESDDQAVRALLARMAAGEVDVIAFTSGAQVERLFAAGPAELARAALAHTRVAAIGPVVADALACHGVAVDLMPRDSFFLRPLTRALEEALGAPKRPASPSAPRGR